MEIIRLSSVADIFSGFAFSTNDMKEEGTPILKIGNIKEDGTLNLETDSFYPHQVTSRLAKFYLRKSDYLVCMTGATIGKIGRSFSVDENKYLINQRVGIIRAYDNINFDYLYYILALKDFRKYIEMVGAGAAQANISAKNIGKFRLKCEFDITKQKNIASFLKKYDKLLEINNERIDKLERIAFDLYKEWFVYFRLPDKSLKVCKQQQPLGWKLSSNKETAIPENWKFDELKNIGEFRRGKNITAAEMIDGDIPVVSAGLEPSGFHNKPNVKGVSLTISSSGANAGYLSYHLDDIWAADCSYCQSKYIWFIYNALKFLQPVISNMQVGAAQPHVYAKNINRLSTIIPTEEWIIKYCDIVEPIFDTISNLLKQNQNLIRQRDYLLPRLMSGKIDLEGKVLN